MAIQAVEVPSKRPSLRERLDVGNGFMPYFLVLPTVLVALAVAVSPILNSLWFSFLDNPPGPSAGFIGWSNYVQLFTSSEFRSSINTTLIFTTIAVTLETIFGLFIALLLQDTFPGRGLAQASILVPWAFPSIVSAQMWALMYNDRTGIISYFLQQMHILAPGATLLQTNTQKCQLRESFAVFYQKVCHRKREAINAHYELVDRTWNRNNGRVLLPLLASPCPAI